MIGEKVGGLELFDGDTDPIDFVETDKSVKNQTEETVEQEVEVKFKAKKPLKKMEPKKVKVVAEAEEEETEEVEEEVVEEEVDETEEVADTEDLTEKFNSLKELGYLYVPEDYQFDGTEAALEKAIEDSDKYRMRDAAVSLWNQLPDTFRPLLEYALKGGTDINKYKEVFVSGADIDKFDLTDEEHQRAAVRELYKARGFSEAKIQKDITRMEDSGDLADEATEAVQELSQLKASKRTEEFKRVELEKKSKELKEQEAFNVLKRTAEESENLNGYQIPAAKRNEVLNSLYKKVRDDEGNFTTDFNYKLNKVVLRDPRLVLVLSDLMSRIQEDESGNKYFDFSHINKKAESEAAKKLKRSIDIATSTASKTGTNVADKTLSSKAFDWESVVI